MAARKKKRAPARRRATAAEGPVTLDEALALARRRVPATPVRRQALNRRGTNKPVEREVINEDRRKLEIATDAENKRRIAEYRETMRILEKRGAKPSAAAGGPTRRAAQAPKVIKQPIRVFAEGDSWFDYPVPFFGGGVIPRLQKRLGVPVLSLAKAGDEVRFMLGVKERKILDKHLRDGAPSGGAWDALLFSGGGNDIVDNPMALWIRDFDRAIPLEDHIHPQRFQTALALVRAGYEDLIEMRDRLTPNTVLLFNAYDFAIPDGRNICSLGPWLKPTFDLRKFPSQAAGFAVVKEMLTRFRSMLVTLAAASTRVEVIDTQGTLNPVVASWHNELHPQKAGFEQFAAKFRDKLKELFPDRAF